MSVLEENDTRIKLLEHLIAAAGHKIEDEPRLALAEWDSDGPRLCATTIGVLIADAMKAAKQRELELLAVIEKQRNALKNTACRTDGDGEDCWCSEMQSGLFRGQHAKWCIEAREILATTEPSQALREHEAKIAAEYKHDAERYRWVRDECTAEKAPQHTWIVESPGDLWDAAIDAAMAEERRKK